MDQGGSKDHKSGSPEQVQAGDDVDETNDWRPLGDIRSFNEVMGEFLLNSLAMVQTIFAGDPETRPPPPEPIDERVLSSVSRWYFKVYPLQPSPIGFMNAMGLYCFYGITFGGTFGLMKRSIDILKRQRQNMLFVTHPGGPEAVMKKSGGRRNNFAVRRNTQENAYRNRMSTTVSRAKHIKLYTSRTVSLLFVYGLIEQTMGLARLKSDQYNSGLAAAVTGGVMGSLRGRAQGAVASIVLGVFGLTFQTMHYQLIRPVVITRMREREVEMKKVMVAALKVPKNT